MSRKQQSSGTGPKRQQYLPLISAIGISAQLEQIAEHLKQSTDLAGTQQQAAALEFGEQRLLESSLMSLRMRIEFPDSDYPRDSELPGSDGCYERARLYLKEGNTKLAYEALSTRQRALLEMELVHYTRVYTYHRNPQIVRPTRYAWFRDMQRWMQRKLVRYHVFSNAELYSNHVIAMLILLSKYSLNSWDEVKSLLDDTSSKITKLDVEEYLTGIGHIDHGEPKESPLLAILDPTDGNCSIWPTQ